MHYIARIAMPHFGKHAHPGMPVVVQPDEQQAEHRLVVAFLVRDAPFAPAGMIGMLALQERLVESAQIARSTCIFLISAMARAGLRPLGHTLAQFMMVWQR